MGKDGEQGWKGAQGWIWMEEITSNVLWCRRVPLVNNSFVFFNIGNRCWLSPTRRNNSSPKRSYRATTPSYLHALCVDISRYTQAQRLLIQSPLEVQNTCPPFQRKRREKPSLGSLPPRSRIPLPSPTTCASSGSSRHEGSECHWPSTLAGSCGHIFQICGNKGFFKKFLENTYYKNVVHRF